MLGTKLDSNNRIEMGGNLEKVLYEIANWISRENKRITIGISGHGASGKTTFAHNLLKVLEPDDVNYINTDPYIIGSQLRKFTYIDYEYNNEHHRDKMTACHPAAHNILALERDLHMIRDGLDFYTIGTPYTKSKLISSQNKINIVEGMSVAFTDPDLYNLKVYFSFIKKYKAAAIIILLLGFLIEASYAVDKFLFKIIVDKSQCFS